MNSEAIGVFDSGIGGLTSVKELNELLPNENIIYFGDTARLPYGSRSKETILKYAAQDVNFLKSHKIKMIIAACGTVSSVIGSKPLVNDIPFTGVLLPTAQSACGATRNGRIGVIGTQATIRSGSYGKAIKNIRPNTFVVGNPCPLFVPLVENGYTDFGNKVTTIVAKQYLEVIKNEGVDTLILGCTHYPILKDIIADIMGDSVTLISPGEEAAKYANMCLLDKDLLNDSEEVGKNTYYVSDSVEMFEENAKMFLGHDVHGDVFIGDVHNIVV